MDGSKDGQGRVEVGYCITDDKGSLLAIGTLNRGNNPIIVVEARRLRQGIRAATKLGYKNLFIEGDNLCVINSFKKVWTTPWKIKGIIEDVVEDLKHRLEMQIAHCYIEANRVADILVKRASNTE